MRLLLLLLQQGRYKSLDANADLCSSGAVLFTNSGAGVGGQAGRQAGTGRIDEPSKLPGLVHPPAGPLLLLFVKSPPDPGSARD